MNTCNILSKMCGFLTTKLVFFFFFLIPIMCYSQQHQVVAGASSVDINVMSADTGKYYYVMYNSPISDYSVSTIKNLSLSGINSPVRNGQITISATEKNQNITHLISNLVDNKIYYLYVTFQGSSPVTGNAANYMAVLPERQVGKSYVSNTPSISGKTIKYLLYKPESYIKSQTQKTYPLLLFCHGDGEKGTNVNTLKNTAIPKLIDSGTDLDFIVASPQTYYPVDWLTPGFLDEFLEKIKADNRIDINRIYITGISGGGGGVYYLPAMQPNKIAAMIPVSATNSFWSFGTQYYCNIKDIPFWGFHNDGDQTVTANNLVVVVNSLNSCVPSPIVPPIKTIYPNNASHDSWTQTYNNPNVFKWLLSKNKSIPTNTAPIITSNASVSSPLLPILKLGASATDLENNLPLSYEWIKISGSDVSISNANSTNPELKNLKTGIYVFRLFVKDALGSASYQDVTINISNAIPNYIPFVDAGTDKTITLPINSVVINGAATDNDGSISSLSWTQVSGNSSILTGNNTNTLTASNLVAGNYVFRLTAVDNLGASSFDDVTVTVLSAPVIKYPLLTITSPVPGKTLAPNSQIDIQVNTSSPSGISKVEFFTSSNVKIGEDSWSPYSYVVMYNSKVGTYSFIVKSTDKSGNQNTANITVVVDLATPIANVLPVVIITSPANGSQTSNNSVVVNANCTDSDGSISKVEFFDNSIKTGEDNWSPYSYTFYVLPAGVHTFRVDVTDNRGGFSSASSQITIGSVSARLAEETTTYSTPREIKIYPNPVKDNLYIDAVSNYIILNTFGAILKQGNGNEINVSDLKSGIYVIVVDGEYKKFNKE